MRIGWFSPISTQTGISAYSRNVLEALCEAWPRDKVDIIVFHPPSSHELEKMPYPTIELSDSLLRSDFGALFDIAIYHIGNNSLHHSEIYKAIKRYPGVIVLHDYVYQHYLAGLNFRHGFISPSFSSLIYEMGGGSAFEFLAESGVLKADGGSVSYVPWESEWSTTVPLCDVFARLGVGVIVHSAYARHGLGSTFAGEILELFMPRPSAQPAPQLLHVPEGRIHIVCGGHIGPTKSLRLLITAFLSRPKLRDQFKVTIAGFGSDGEFLRTLRLDLQNPVVSNIFELRVDPTDDEYKSIMSSADIFYNLRFPNTEGSSLSLVEQLSYGRPVIAYRTGCFAETPEDAGYFLTKVGDPEELAALLDRIAADPLDLTQRGQKAWATVRENDAGSYASHLINFLHERMPALRRRVNLLLSRSHGTAPAPTQEDEDWFVECLNARRQIDALTDDLFFLPENILNDSDEKVGRFVSKNLLCSILARENMISIGRILHNMNPIDAIQIIVKLVILSERTIYGRDLLPGNMRDLFLPVVEPEFWDILSELRPQQAVPLAVLGLGITFEPEGIQQLIKDAEHNGFERVIAETLRGLDKRRWPNPDFKHIAARLEARGSEITGNLLPLPIGTDLLSVLTPTSEQNNHLGDLGNEDFKDEIGYYTDSKASVYEEKSAHFEKSYAVLTGFHPPEVAGIWSRTTDASVLLRPGTGVRVSAIAGGLSLMKSPDTGQLTVSITVFELQSDRSQMMRVHFPAGLPPKREWKLDLPGFHGPIRVQISTSSVRSPQEAGISADQRLLGVMVWSLCLFEASDSVEEASV